MSGLHEVNENVLLVFYTHTHTRIIVTEKLRAYVVGNKYSGLVICALNKHHTKKHFCE